VPPPENIISVTGPALIIARLEIKMSYMTVMVHVDVDTELSGRVSIAAEISDSFRARLIGVAGWAPMSALLPKKR
jgi:hypothetical protein